MKSVDTVEKKNCTQCTIMNFMLIITAIVIIALMTSCVPPSSVREGRVVGFNKRDNDQRQKRDESKEEIKDMSNIDQSKSSSRNLCFKSRNQIYS